MHNQTLNGSVCVFDKLKLDVSRFEKEVGFRFGEQLGFRLCVSLRHQLSVFIGKGKVRQRKLNPVLSDVFIQNGRCDVDGFTLSRNFIRRAEDDSRQDVADFPRRADAIVAQNDDGHALGGKAGDIIYETG